MFCTQCGNPVDPSKNFCGNCGTKIAKSSPTAVDESTTKSENAPAPTIIESRTQFMSAQTLALDTEALDQPAKRRNGKLIMIAAAIIVLIGAGAGIYYGTDLLRSTPAPEPVALAPAVPPIAAPSAPREENTQGPSETKQNDLWEPSQPTPPEPPPAAQTESPKPPPPPRAKAVPQEEPAPPPRRAAREQALEPAPSPASQTRLTPTAAVYETVRPTLVYAEPSTSSKVVSNIESGVRLTVVGANNDWLELRSRLGNLPGFVRREYARPLSGNN